VFSHVEYCDMHFVYGFCDGNALDAVEEYRRRFPDRRIPSRHVFTRIHQTLRDTGCFPGAAVRSEREVVGTINTRENILEMVKRSPRLSTRKMASRIRVSRSQVWRTLREEDLSVSRSNGTSGTRRPCSTYGFVPLDTSTSRTVRRHFIHR